LPFLGIAGSRVKKTFDFMLREAGSELRGLSKQLFSGRATADGLEVTRGGKRGVLPFAGLIQESTKT